MGVLQHNSTGSILTQEKWEDDSTHLIGGVADTNIVRSATYVVAASDSPAHVRAQADYVCGGVTDQTEISTAINNLQSTGGTVLISPGNYTISAGMSFDIGTSFTRLIKISAFAARFNHTSDDYAFTFATNAALSWPSMLKMVTFEGGIFIGNSGTSAGSIKLDRLNGGNFSQCKSFSYTNGSMFRVETDADECAEYNTFENCESWWCKYYISTNTAAGGMANTRDTNSIVTLGDIPNAIAYNIRQQMARSTIINPVIHNQYTQYNKGFIFTGDINGLTVISPGFDSHANAGKGKLGFVFGKQYLTLNGTSDFITIPSHSSLDPSTGDFTVEVWAKNTSKTGAKNMVTKEKNASQWNGYTFGFQDANGYLDCYIRDDSGNTTEGLGSVDYSDSVLRHYVMTVDATSATGLQAYVDGTLVALNTHDLSSVTGTLSTTADMFIGKFRDTTGYFSGNIYKVAFYKRVLGATEILNNYNEGVYGGPSDITNLGGYWDFSEYDGTSLIDSSSNTNNGTLTGCSRGTASGASGDISIISEQESVVTDTFKTIEGGKNITVRGVKNYIAQGEVRTASGSLTGGTTNSILFAWHNPEAQDIMVKKVVLNLTDGDTDAPNIDVGIADDAIYTNGGIEFFDDLTGETTGVYDSVLTPTLGKQTVWVNCQDSASSTDGWVVGKILTNDGTSVAGTYYIEYVGK